MPTLILSRIVITAVKRELQVSDPMLGGIFRVCEQWRHCLDNKFAGDELRRFRAIYDRDSNSLESYYELVVTLLLLLLEATEDEDD